MLSLQPGISFWLISTDFFSRTFSLVCPVLAVANADSGVDLHNEIGHLAHRHGRLMQVPVLGAQGI